MKICIKLVNDENEMVLNVWQDNVRKGQYGSIEYDNQYETEALIRMMAPEKLVDLGPEEE